MTRFLVSISFLLLLFTLHPKCHVAAAGGSWNLLQQSVGISAMHMQLLKNDVVVMFDRTDFGPSNISLPQNKCIRNDCTAHSVEYNVVSNTIRPLTVLSDVWCSSGSVNSDGNLIQTGGTNDGDRRVRIFPPCTNGCDWKEIENGLNERRWYASDHILPDGRQIIVGGRNQFNFEFYPKTDDSKTYQLPFLVQTNDRGIENNLYPFTFLNTDGNLFVFANNRAILLEYLNNKVVRTYPIIPGGEPRSYPSTGSAVLLPLKDLKSQNVEAEVLVCGGAPKGAYIQATKGIFVKALKTCARIKITDPNPQWVLEDMPQARVMCDMTLLPNGDVLIINGAGSGSAGWELGREPVLAPDLYRPGKPLGSRFETQNPSTIPRMYHSTAVLLRDGRVLVGGSNPHDKYEFSGVNFPTELRLEAFNPSYLEAKYQNVRPKTLFPLSGMKIKYDQKLKVWFNVRGAVTKETVTVTMVFPSFSTHSFSMNQRVLVLGNDKVVKLGLIITTYNVEVRTPKSKNLAPPGYYLLYVVHQDIPSEGIWVHLS